MKRSERCTFDMKRLYAELSARVSSGDGKKQHDPSSVLHAAKDIIKQLQRLDIERACHVQHERDIELLLGRQEGNVTLFRRFIGSDDEQILAAEVYPNAHNAGATYGIKIEHRVKGRDVWSGGKFCGVAWTKEAAHAAARSWVLDVIMPQFKD